MSAVERIRRVLGEDVVLLKVAKLGKNPTDVGWQKLSAAEMTPEYLDGLNHGGNIGVSLGRASDGLHTIDIDRDELIEPFLALNPALRGALRTTRVRGGNIWLRTPGEYPGTSVITDASGKAVGEWRSTGAQTVIYGEAIDKKKGETTPTKYRVVSGEHLAVIAFDQIVWPDEWKLTNTNATDEADALAMLKKQHGEPYYLNERGKPRELNEGFWAALYAAENHVLWEPAEKNFYRYSGDDGIYHQESPDAIKRELSGRLLSASRQMNCFWLESQRSDRKLAGIVAHLRGHVETRNAFENKDKAVVLGNGVLRLSGDGELCAFTPSIRARNRSPIIFDESAKCPRFLGELVEPAMSADDVLLIQKYAGLCLLGDNLIQRMLILDGEAGRGKTQLANALQAVIGRENISELRTKFLGERFETYRFRGKTLLIGVDVVPDFLSTKGASVLKGLVGGDWFDCEQKGGTASFPMQGKFSAIVTSNARLRVRLQGDVGAWRRRLLIVRYEAPPPKRKIPDFGQLLARKEGPGILNWCLAGLSAVLADVDATGDIAMTDRQIGVVDSLLAESDSLRVFLREKLKKEDGGDVTVTEIVEAYAAFCPEKGWHAPSITEIHNSLEGLMLEMFATAKAHSIERGGKSVRGFRGVALC